MARKAAPTNLFVIACALLPATASALSKDDFAYGYEIAAAPGKSIVEVMIPADIYQTAKFATLADLAVFNGRDELVPHVIGSPVPRMVETPQPPVPLTMFPVFAEKKGEQPFSQIKVATSADGAILEIQSKSLPAAVKGQGKPESKKISGYLIDATKINPATIGRSFSKLRFKLESAGNYFVKVNVEGSQDLETWVPLERGSVLANFVMNGEKLGKDEIPLNGVPFKYFRVSWENPLEEAKLLSVDAVFPNETGQVEEPLQWREQTGSQVLDATDKNTTYLYDTGGYFPVSALKVKFADQNSIARLEFLASNMTDGPWNQIGSASVYSFQREGATFDRLESSFPESRYRYWRVRLMSSSGGVGAKFPALSIGWRPGNVKFIARGESPFVLAYGGAGIQNPQQPELLQSQDWKNSITPGTLKEKVTLGGADKLTAVVKGPEQPWRKYMLGGVLFLGVILLGGMALQVRKEIPPGQG